MGDKSVETLCNKIEFLSILVTFPPFPPKQCWFFYFFDCTDHSAYTTLNWGAGSIRGLTLEENKIEQMIKYRKASFPKCPTTFVAHCRFTLEEIVPYSWWIRNVLVPNWFSRLHTRGRIRNENIPVWSLLRRFWIWNLKKELGIRKLLIPESFFRVNVFLSNSDIFPPAILWVCGITKMAVPVIQSNPKS